MKIPYYLSIMRGGKGERTCKPLQPLGYILKNNTMSDKEFDTKEYWKQKYITLRKEYDILYSGKTENNKKNKLVKIKIYEVPESIFKLKVCK